MDCTILKMAKFETVRILFGFLILAAFSQGEGRAQELQYFPQLADGGGYSTTLYIAGLGKTDANVQVDFFTQTGTGLAIQTSMGTASTFSFAVPQNGQVTLRTAGTSSKVTAGWIRVSSTVSVGATEIFSYAQGGIVQGQAGVLPTVATGAVTLLVSIDGRGQDTGMAIANVSALANVVTFTLYDQAGTVAKTTTTTISPQNQIAIFVDQLAGFEGIATPFQGTLSISGTSAFSIVGLLLTGPQLSTLATLPARIPLPSSNTVQVPAITSIFLAGQPNGKVLGQDTAPLNLPVEAGIGLIPLKELQFTAAGSVKNPSELNALGPDGNINNLLCNGGGTGLSGITAREAGLVGVFLGPDAPKLPQPPDLSFAGGVAQLNQLQPLLQQLFYIGVGTANNLPKRIAIPNGATRLFLASLECGNVSARTGQFSVTVQYVQ